MFKIIKKAISGGGSSSHNSNGNHRNSSPLPAVNSHATAHNNHAARANSPTTSNSVNYISYNQNAVALSQQQSTNQANQNNLYYANNGILKKDLKGTRQIFAFTNCKS